MTAALHTLSARQMASAMRDGECSAEELAEDCLSRIAAVEPQVGAWVFLDPDHVIAQARAADRQRASGHTLGPLHGVPVAVKDIFDTADMPTEDGTPLHAGRTPAFDATAVALLREAGAIIMGKTVTTELAVYAPGKTTNPHDSTRTPGGSSSGSAAAVAAGMVPLALGTQTNGSVIRPASYCGVYGYKPSFGRISRYRVLRQSRILDHVGVFARDLEDTALIGQSLMRFDERDPDMRPRSVPQLSASVTQKTPLTPRLALVRTPRWQNADEDVHNGFAELADFLGDQLQTVDLPEPFDTAYDWHRTIMETDLAVSFAREYELGAGRMSPQLREMIARGQTCLATDYRRAIDGIAVLRNALDEIFEEFDAIVTPATTGEAPVGLDSTGSPEFCTLWTLCGTPSVSLPLLNGSHGMPVGIQMVGALGDDARLLRTANWLAQAVAASES